MRHRTDPYVINLNKGKTDPVGLHLVCLPSGEGAVVVNVAEGTVAFKNGDLRRGQVLTSVNSIPLRFNRTVDIVETIQYCGNNLEFTVAGYVDEPMLLEILHINELADENMAKMSWGAIMMASIKFPFALPVLLILFAISIIEGFFRMAMYRILSIFHIISHVPDTKNICFDILIVVWYLFVLDMDVQYVDIMKRMQNDVVVKKHDADVGHLNSHARHHNGLLASNGESSIQL